MIVIGGCSTASYNASNTSIPKNKVYAVDVFSNYTETAMAGYRAAAITNAILLGHGYESLIMYDSSDEEFEKNKELLNERIKKAKENGAAFLVSGEVVEWRYKTGIDGEPAVSIIVKIYDTTTSNIIYSCVGSKNGLGYSSVGIVAQDIINRMIP